LRRGGLSFKQNGFISIFCGGISGGNRNAI